MAEIRLENIRKAFGHNEVIEGIDLEIAHGEFCVFLGPSGCGKSTLLRLIAGLEAVTDGKIHIGGREVTRLPPGQRNVAMVFQSYALYPHMTAYENMAFGLRLARRDRGEIKRRVSEAARTLQIDHLLEHKPAQLSGGQRQRVAIGRAMVREPRVFLLDEPLSNLDADLRVRMRLEFARLHRRLDTTMVYVTHDQVEAMTLADRLVLLQDGRVAQCGAPLELYQRPRNLFVAGFLGSPRMNFLPGRLEKIDPGRATVALPTGTRVRVDTDASRAAVGDSITLGVRPEHLSLHGGEGNRLDGSVTLVERLGDHSLIYVEWSPDEPPLIIRMTGEAVPETGKKLSIGLPADSCHLFGAGGEALQPP